MPEGGEQAHEAEDGSQDTEEGLAVATMGATAQYAMTHSVCGIDIQAYEHPNDKSQPGVGGQE